MAVDPEYLFNKLRDSACIALDSRMPHLSFASPQIRVTVCRKCEKNISEHCSGFAAGIMEMS